MQQNRRKHVKEYNLNKPIVYEDYNMARFNSKESLLCIIQKQKNKLKKKKNV